jgi:hypothetical protein
MSELSASPAVGSVEVPAFREAFQSVLGEMRALPKEQVQTVNLEIPVAVTTVMGALPAIRALRSRVLEELPRFEILRFDKLQIYTAAMAHAHTLFMAASKGPEQVAELAEQCAGLREVLLSDTQALAKRGIIDGGRLKDLKGNNSYRYTAFDLFTLVQILRENQAKIQGKTAVEPAELERAQLLAEKLTKALGEREQASSGAAAAADDRDRAFTLFIRTYSDVQHAVYYLSPDDSDDIAPTVYVGGRPPGRKKPQTPDTPVVPVEPSAPAPTASAPVANRVPVGMPGSDPFTS